MNALASLAFLKNGGETGRQILAQDWSQHPLGTPDTWPLELRTALGMLYGSDRSLILYWGPQRFCFYNDAFLPLFKTLNFAPGALGDTGPKIWGEGWSICLKRIEEVEANQRAYTQAEHRVGMAEREAYYSFSYAPIFGGGGTVAGIWVTCLESTEHVRVEEKLQQSDTRLKLALECAQMGTWHADFRTNKVWTSPELDAMIGTHVDDDVSASIDRCVHPDDRALVEQSWKEAVANRDLYNCEYRVLKPDGKMLWLHSRGRAIYDADGKPLSILGVSLDISARKETAEAIRESEELFRTLADSIPQMVWMTDENGEIRYLNRHWVDFTGMEVGYRGSFTDFLHPDDVAPTRKIWNRAFKNGSVYRAEYRLRNRHTGEYRWFKSESEPKRDSEGKIRRWFGTCTDIEERKRAQIEFEKNVDSSPAMLWITDVDGACTYLSRQWYEHTGQNPAMSLGWGWLEATHPQDRERVNRLFREANAKHEAFHTEYRLKTKSGAYRWAIDAANPRFDAQGNYLGFAGTVFDIHEQKLAALAVEQSAEQFRLYAEAMPQMAFIADGWGRITYFNERWYKYVGLQAETKGWAWKDLPIHHPDDLARTLDAWQEAIRTGNQYEIEYRLRRHDGEYRWHLGRAVPQRGPEGEIIRWFGTNTDIHDQKMAEANLRRALDMRDEFMLIAGHELRTPVSSLKLQNQILERKIRRQDLESLKPEKVIEGVHTAKRQIEWLSHLIEDMLDVSRLAANQIQFHKELFDLTAATQSLLTSFDDQFEQHRIQASFAAKGPVWVVADQGRIEQVLRNLLTNAIKYGNRSPVEVSVSREDDHAILRVRDRGEGIAPEHRERIFHRYERAVPATAVSGLGLGLYITRQILNAHGGSVEVFSEPGLGAEFRVTLEAANR